MTFQLYTNFRLSVRSALFVWGLVSYLTDGVRIDAILSQGLWEWNLFLVAAWLIMLLGILLRFFPMKSESMGAMKQFARYFRPREKADRERIGQQVRQGNRDAWMALALWVPVNAVIYWLYLTQRISAGMMLLISLFYGVMDMVCIKFYCPFQRWMMKNRCCTTCRIYNWDFLMAHTPTVLIPHPMAVPLWLGSALLAVRWEWNWNRHPERFVEAGNQALSCASCQHPESCQSCVRKKRPAVLAQKSTSKTS